MTCNSCRWAKWCPKAGKDLAAKCRCYAPKKEDWHGLQKDMATPDFQDRKKINAKYAGIVSRPLSQLNFRRRIFLKSFTLTTTTINGIAVSALTIFHLFLRGLNLNLSLHTTAWKPPSPTCWPAQRPPRNERKGRKPKTRTVRKHLFGSTPIPLLARPRREAEADRDRLREALKPNCILCDSMHENGNCTEVGGFCTAVPAANCPLIPRLRDQLTTTEARAEEAEKCIYAIEDDLDRGNDNDRAREHIAEWKGQKEE